MTSECINALMILIILIVLLKAVGSLGAFMKLRIYTQLFYFIICLLQSSTCFEQRRAHHQEVKLCYVYSIWYSHSP
jgi:hypothetical protein